MNDEVLVNLTLIMDEMFVLQDLLKILIGFFAFVAVLLLILIFTGGVNSG